MMHHSKSTDNTHHSDVPKIPYEDFLLQDQQTKSKTVLCLLDDNDNLDNDNLLRLKRDPKHSSSLWKAKEESFDGRLCHRPGYPC